MGLIESYIFRTARTAFVASLGVLTAVIWLTQAMREFDLLTTKGQSLLTFLGVTALGIPSLVMVIAPVALFIAVIYVLNRLNGDSELVVMSAAGFGPVRLLRPFAKLTVLTGLLVAAMSIYVMPWSFRDLRTLIVKIRADFLTHVVREGSFSTLDEGFVFHYRERAADGALRGILMEDRRDPAHISSYVAEEGRTFEADDNNYLVLTKGNVERRDQNTRDTAIVVFDRYALDLAQFGSEGGGAPLKPRERSTRELFDRNPNDDYVRSQEGRFRAELHDRFVNPLYALSFGMVAFAAMGQPRTTRQGRSTAMLTAVATVLLVRIAGFGASSLVVKSAAWIPLDYGVPILALTIAALAAFGLRFALPRPRSIVLAVAKPA